MLMYTNCFHKHFHTPVSVDMRMPPKRSLSTLERERFYWKTGMIWSYQVMASDLDERRKMAMGVFAEVDPEVAVWAWRWDVLFFMDAERMLFLKEHHLDPFTAHKMLTTQCLAIIQERAGIRIIRSYDLTVLAGEMMLEIFNGFAEKIWGTSHYNSGADEPERLEGT
jgi:hypothetical protein